jgi:hypothetical protein
LAAAPTGSLMPVVTTDSPLVYNALDTRRWLRRLTDAGRNEGAASYDGHIIAILRRCADRGENRFLEEL